MACVSRVIQILRIISMADVFSMRNIFSELGFHLKFPDRIYTLSMATTELKCMGEYSKCRFLFIVLQPWLLSTMNYFKLLIKTSGINESKSHQ